MLSIQTLVRGWHARAVENGDLVDVGLTEDELAFLRAALLEWGGPARPDHAMVRAMGFSSTERLSDQTSALWERLHARPALSRDEWRKVLLAAEVVFASDVVGSGLDWPLTTGMPDVQTIGTLRGLQRKLARARNQPRAP